MSGPDTVDVQAPPAEDDRDAWCLDTSCSREGWHTHKDDGGRYYAAPLPGHFITVDLGEYGPHYRYGCTMPEGSACRLSCADRDCESWHIERDEQGAFHSAVVDIADDGTEVTERHRLTDQGECNVGLFWDNADVSPFGDDDEIVLRVTPSWDGDGYVVEDFAPAARSDPR